MKRPRGFLFFFFPSSSPSPFSSLDSDVKKGAKESKKKRMKKKIDSRIKTLIENGVTSNHRSLFVIVGDKGRDQVVNLHYMLTKAAVKKRPSVLWCYKKELGFSR